MSTSKQSRQLDDYDPSESPAQQVNKRPRVSEDSRDRRREKADAALLGVVVKQTQLEAAAASGSSLLRQSIPCFLCDGHNDALQVWHYCIRKKQLPFQSNFLVHFDSHPDLSLPPNFPADAVFQPQTLYDTVDISEFILPAVYAGHIDKMLWVKPAWSNQIPPGYHKVLVGKQRDSGHLCVFSNLAYFIDDAATVGSLAELEGGRVLHLFVTESPLSDAAAISSLLALQSSSLATPDFEPPLHASEPSTLPPLGEPPLHTPGPSWILDIDLDYFSTASPWIDEFLRHRTAPELFLLQSMFVSTFSGVPALPKDALLRHVGGPDCLDAFIDTSMRHEESLLNERKILSWRDYAAWKQRVHRFLDFCRRRFTSSEGTPSRSEFVGASRQILGSEFLLPNESKVALFLEDFYALFRSIQENATAARSRESSADPADVFTVEDAVQVIQLLIHPHVKTNERYWRRSIRESVHQAVQLLVSLLGSVPSVVSLALSKSDGHTPEGQAESMEAVLQEELRSVFTQRATITAACPSAKAAD